MSEAYRTAHAVYCLNCHFVWVPRYRWDVLIGYVVERAKEVFYEIAERYEFKIEHGRRSCAYLSLSTTSLFSGQDSEHHGEHLYGDCFYCVPRISRTAAIKAFTRSGSTGFQV